jgi:regulator of sigma E protease
MMILKIVAALLLLGVVIMIHEFGHFLAARAMGVRVNEFAIGMGPKLLKFRKGETLYTVRAIPIGGFCAMEGEDEEAPTPSAIGGNSDRDSEPADETRSFAHKKVWQRIVIVVAGALMNLLLGFLLLLVYNGFLQEPYDDKGTVLFPTTTIARLDESTPAYQTGLRAGDTILSINGRRVRMDSDMAMEMQNDADGVLQMVVQRGEEKVTLDGVTFELRKDKETGRNYLVYDFVVLGEVRTVGNTITQSAKQEVSVATIVWRSLIDMVRGRYGLNDLSGPVGTVDIIADAVGEVNTLAGWQTLVMLLVMITVNLGVFNLLPLPALDGGRLIFLLWELVTRRRVPQKFEGIVHFVGLLLLILLMLVVSYSDVTKLFV